MNISGVGGGGGARVTTEFCPVLLIPPRECAGMNPCKRNLYHISSFLHSNASKFCFFVWDARLGPFGTVWDRWDR